MEPIDQKKERNTRTEKLFDIYIMIVLFEFQKQSLAFLDNIKIAKMTI
jgi:hypothetical protein